MDALLSLSTLLINLSCCSVMKQITNLLYSLFQNGFPTSLLICSYKCTRTIVCVMASVCGEGASGKNTCAKGNLSLCKECDSDPGMKVSVCQYFLCTEAGALLLSTIMTDSKSYLFRACSLT